MYTEVGLLGIELEPSRAALPLSLAETLRSRKEWEETCLSWVDMACCCCWGLAID